VKNEITIKFSRNDRILIGNGKGEMHEYLFVGADDVNDPALDVIRTVLIVERLDNLP